MRIKQEDHLVYSVKVWLREDDKVAWRIDILSGEHNE